MNKVELEAINGGSTCEWKMLFISTGASMGYGAAIGSVFPVAGNIVGGLVGLGLGTVGLLGCGRHGK
ncbi:hypothetical protein [Amphibacillus sediminis]|uniref:hypothetical protein n=1 Tax=Amphibacillus sediminis TaxID=360185 RepID=UPI00082E1E85|nr:hypothetical protein [Amphibacillus sediminis]